MKQIWKRLSNIKPPHYIGRLPKDLEKLYANFKATKIQVWLLLYGIPCMEDILSYQFLNHFSQLAKGVYLLLGDSITMQEMDRAEALLQSFYASFEALYNQGPCGLNVHNCGVHIIQYVYLWGLLWSWSYFPFEDCNACILQCVHGTGNVTHQVIHNQSAQSFLMTKSINPSQLSGKRRMW